MGRETQLTDATGVATNYTYNTYGQLTGQNVSGIYPVTYAYDPTYGDRITMGTYRNTSAGAVDMTTWTYDAATGLICSKTDSAGKSVTYQYNIRGQVSSRTWAPNGSPTNSTSVTTTYTYFGDNSGDPATGELKGVTYSDGTPAVSYTYTRAGKMNSVADATGTRNFIYDSSQPLQLDAVDLGSFYSNRVLTRQYNQDGLLPGRPAGFFLGNSSSLSADLAQTYYYNSQGRFDHLATAVSGQNPVTFNYGYVTNTALVGTISAAGAALQVTRDYESQRDLLTSIKTQLTGSPGTTLAEFDYTYDARQQRQTATQSGTAYADYYSGTNYSSVSSAYSYDSAGDLTRMAQFTGNTPSGGTEIPGRHFAYAYDTAGNRTLSGPVDPGSSGVAVDDTYATNSLNQYTSKTNNTVRILGNVSLGTTVTASGATVSQLDRNFAADIVPGNGSGPASGQVSVTANLLTSNGEVTNSAVRNFWVAAASQALEYDWDGNLISDGVWNYSYDAENRLLRMNNASGLGNLPYEVDFTYDYLGRRVEKKVWQTATQVASDRLYVYNGWNLVAELNAGTGGLVRSYTWGLDLTGSLKAAGGVGALLEIANVSSGSVTGTFLTAMDGNGNVVALVNASTNALAMVYEYAPFGEMLRAEVFDSAIQDNPFRFSSKFTDVETGLIYYGARYYSPALGRFLSRDPIEEAGGLNLYAFCGNNPVNKWDYQGQMPEWLKTICSWFGFDVNTDPHGNNTPDPTIGSGPNGQNANGEGGPPVGLPPVIVSATRISGDTSSTQTANTNTTTSGLMAVTSLRGLSAPSAGRSAVGETGPKPAPNSTATTGPITYTGSISYSYVAFVASWGTFTGQVASPTGQAYNISGNINGVGLQAGYFSGTVPVSFPASSPQNIGSNGIFLTVAGGVTDGPLSLAGIEQNVFFNGGNLSPSANLPELTVLGISTDFSPTHPFEIVEPGTTIGGSIAVQFPTVTNVTPAPTFVGGGGCFGGHGAGGRW